MIRERGGPQCKGNKGRLQERGVVALREEKIQEVQGNEGLLKHMQLIAGGRRERKIVTIWGGKKTKGSVGLKNWGGDHRS